MTKPITYPFVPSSNAHLRPGQFFAIPLPDGRTACGRVLHVDREASYGARTHFLGGLMDWVGARLPTADDIAGKAILSSYHAHVRAISQAGGEVLGLRDFALDGLLPPTDAPCYLGGAGLAQLAQEAFTVAPTGPQPFERRALVSPLTDEVLEPMDALAGCLQFTSLPTTDELRRLDLWFAKHPHVSLRAFAHVDGSISDLSWLRHLPSLRRLWIELYTLPSLDGLHHLSRDLVELGIGPTQRPLDLAGIARFGGLQTLSIEGQTRGIAALSSLLHLRELTLRSVTLPDLSLLLPLQDLRSLELKLGGTTDLAHLHGLRALRYLELWQVRGLTDLTAVGQVQSLRALFLQSLRHVTTLPDLSANHALASVELESMKGLHDLRPLRTAPALRDVVLTDMGHLSLQDLSPLVDHPTLATFRGGLSSVKKNEAAAALVGLPSRDAPYDWRVD